MTTRTRKTTSSSFRINLGLADELIVDAEIKRQLKGLMDHVKDVEGLYKKSNKSLTRRRYSALRADLRAVFDSFEGMRVEARSHDYEQRELFDCDSFGAISRGTE